MERKFFLMLIFTLASTFSVFLCEIKLNDLTTVTVAFTPVYDRQYVRSDTALREELQRDYSIDRAMKIRDSDYQAKCSFLLSAAMLAFYTSSRVFSNYQLLNIDRTCYEAGCVTGSMLGLLNFYLARHKRKMFTELQPQLSEQQLDDAILKLGITNVLSRVGERKPF